MSGTTSPTSCYVDVTGIHSPAFEDILTYLQNQVQSIFGSDIYLGNDSQDGQMLGIFASAIYDTNSMAIAVYNSFSPSTAQGLGLSSVTKINGIARLIPTNSAVDLVIVGVAGTVINSGIVSDQNGNRWFLPPVVIIPVSGQITQTANAEVAGAITALPNTVNKISTPTLGWQSVSNPLAAGAGAPLETDAALRARQTRSTMLPSVSALDGIIGAIASLKGVTRLQTYENDTNQTDGNGIPSHSLCFVVEGGDVTQIAKAIAAHKTPGAGTFGSTSIQVIDPYNVPHNINFFSPPIKVPVTVSVHLTALTGYTSQIGLDIVNAIINYINTLPIGSPVFISKIYAIANLTDSPETLSFNITSIALARNSGTPSGQNIVIAFNEAATASTTTVTLSVP